MSKRSSAVSVFMAALIVGAALTGALGPWSPIQEVRAEWSENCDFTDSLIGAAFNTITGDTTGCHWVSGDQTDVENLTATDAYANALGVKDSTDSYTTSVSNFHQNTRTVALSKAKIALVNELNNDSSVSVANNEVNRTVRDYYARQQVEIIKDWNAKMEQIQYLENGNVDVRYLRKNDSKAFTTINTVSKNNYTLANGSSKEVTWLEWTDGSNYADMSPVETFEESITGFAATVGTIQVQDPDTGTWANIIRTGQYSEDFTGYSGGVPEGPMLLENPLVQEPWVIDNLDPYVDEVYNQYQAGEINSTDLALQDPTVIATEASTDFNSSGYYGYAAIQIAAIGGYGNINASHTVVTGDGTEFNGTLYYTDSDHPTDGFATNQTYNFSNFNGTFYFVDANEDAPTRVHDLADYGNEVTITKAENTNTGEQLNTTTVNRYTYETTNASALQEEIDRLYELRQTYEEQSSGGAGGDGSSGLNNTVIIALVAALGGAYLIGGKD